MRKRANNPRKPQEPTELRSIALSFEGDWTPREVHLIWDRWQVFVALCCENMLDH